MALQSVLCTLSPAFLLASLVQNFWLLITHGVYLAESACLSKFMHINMGDKYSAAFNMEIYSVNQNEDSMGANDLLPLLRDPHLKGRLVWYQHFIQGSVSSLEMPLAPHPILSVNVETKETVKYRVVYDTSKQANLFWLIPGVITTTRSWQALPLINDCVDVQCVMQRTLLSYQGLWIRWSFCSPAPLTPSRMWSGPK